MKAPWIFGASCRLFGIITLRGMRLLPPTRPCCASRPSPRCPGTGNPANPFVALRRSPAPAPWWPFVARSWTTCCMSAPGTRCANSSRGPAEAAEARRPVPLLCGRPHPAEATATRRLQIRTAAAVEWEELRAAIVLFDEPARTPVRRDRVLKCGWGGDRRVATLLGIDPSTVATGRRQLIAHDVEVDRVRRAGGQRKPASGNAGSHRPARNPDGARDGRRPGQRLEVDLPRSPPMRALGIDSVRGRSLARRCFSLRVNHKKLAGASHPDRFMRAPLRGPRRRNFASAPPSGTAPRTRQRSRFSSQAEGVGHLRPALENRRHPGLRPASRSGCRRYPVQILADSGGSNGCTPRAWKFNLQHRLCNRLYPTALRTATRPS